MPNAFYQRTVLTVRIRIVNRDEMRNRLTLRVVSGTTPLYIGDSQLLLTSGTPVYLGEVIVFEGAEANADVYAIGTGSTVVSIFESRVEER